MTLLFLKAWSAPHCQCLVCSLQSLGSFLMLQPASQASDDIRTAGTLSKSPVHGAGSYQPITALFRILKEKQGTALSCLCPPWPQTKGKSGLKEFLLSASALPCPSPTRLLACAPEGSSSVRYSKKTYRRCTLLKEAETASIDSKEDI